MRFPKFILLLLLLTACSLPVYAADGSLSLSASLDIDLLLQRGVERGLISGAVVVIGSRDGILLQKTFGTVSAAPGAPPMTMGTVFDLASLTKVIATTPAVMKLAEEGKIRLVDPVSRFFPEFAADDKKDMLVMNLLTHTTGLDDFSLPAADGEREAVVRAAGEHLRGEIGNRFQYADINFILLGELVHRVSGKELDKFAAENIYRPLGMNDTGFKPAGEVKDRCAPTYGDRMLVGEVQDPNARLLHGVAGHAGLFSTARDLSLFARMILGEGEVDGKRVLSPRTVQQMTAPYFSRGGSVVRGLGWDMISPFSSPRGRGFSELSFGHTGYSGTSIWIDPERDLFVILLTSRLDYRRVSEFNRLRRDLSTIAGAVFSPEEPPPVAGQPLP